MELLDDWLFHREARVPFPAELRDCSVPQKVEMGSDA
jgi:hypothetical protein